MIEYCIAKKEHLPMILELYKQLTPEENLIDINTVNNIWDDIERDKIKYFIATDGNRVVASCYLAIIPNFTRNGRANGFIENVITDERYRKRGIGKKVVEMAIEYGKQNNCYKIVLLSSYKRKENHVFYEKCGFDGNSKRAFEIRFK